MESILQQFLSTQIINIEEDENHEKLIKASTDLTKILGKDKGKLQKVAISAFDSAIDIEDPIVVETKNIIIKYWSTFINKCQNMPLTYIRAVMLESLKDLSKEDDCAAIIWLSAANHATFFTIEIREKPILAELLASCGDKYEVISQERWSLTSILGNLNIVIPKSSETKKLVGIKEDYIGEAITAAALKNSAIANNPSYGNSNIREDWAKEFGKAAAEGFNAVFASIIKQTNESLITKANNDSFQAFLDTFNKETTIYLNKLVDKNSSTDLRGQLLWFKEALYSYTQKSGYRKLSADTAVIAMSFEFSKITPEYCPVSTEYFLSETLLSVNYKTDENISFEDFLDLISENKAKLTVYFSNFNSVKPGRASLTSYIGYWINGLLDKTTFYQKTGLSLEAKTNMSDLTIWLFREFQAAKFILKK